MDIETRTINDLNPFILKDILDYLNDQPGASLKKMVAAVRRYAADVAYVDDDGSKWIDKRVIREGLQELLFCKNVGYKTFRLLAHWIHSPFPEPYEIKNITSEGKREDSLQIKLYKYPSGAFDYGYALSTTNSGSYSGPHGKLLETEEQAMVEALEDICNFVTKNDLKPKSIIAYNNYRRLYGLNPANSTAPVWKTSVVPAIQNQLTLFA